MSESTDLLPRVARGDPRAVDACVDRYGGLVWSLARRMLRDDTEAEDAVQEVFVELWQNASRFDATISPEPAYVAMLTRRRLVDRLRKRGRQPTPAGLDESFAYIGIQTADALEQKDEATRARAALARLDPPQRRVLELAFWEGLSQSEIAEREGMPLGTVKTHCRRGLIALRSSLGLAEKSVPSSSVVPGDVR